MHFAKAELESQRVENNTSSEGKKEILQIPDLTPQKSAFLILHSHKWSQILKQSFLIFMLNHVQIFPTQALTWERYQEKGLTALKNVLFQYKKTHYSPQTFCLSCMPEPYGSNKHCPHLLRTAALPASPFAICQHHNVWFLFLICSRSLWVKAVKYWNPLPVPMQKSQGFVFLLIPTEDPFPCAGVC